MTWSLENSIRLRSHNSFAALENLCNREDINGAREDINENMKFWRKSVRTEATKTMV
jgi:hypothetical protein